MNTETKHTPKQYKRLEWAYPTSENATRAGFSKTGCWCVEIQTGINPPVFLGGYKTIGEADRFACDIPQSWAPDSKRAFETALVEYVDYKLVRVEQLLEGI